MTVHLALGDAAANAIAGALKHENRSGEKVLRFRDVLALGPLHKLGRPAGAGSRAAYWGQLLPEQPLPRADFVEEEGRYASANELARALVPLVVWAGPHAAARLWLERLCASLGPSADLRLVDPAAAPFAVHEGYHRRAPGEFSTEEICALRQGARLVRPDERSRLARQWWEHGKARGGLRRIEAGRIVNLPDDYYDALLLARSGSEWRDASRVIAMAILDCDEFLGDVFFAWRLRLLVRSGALAHQGQPGYPPNYLVRLPQ